MALTREFFLLEEIITSDRERAILASKKILNILARSSKEKSFFFYRAQLDNLLHWVDLYRKQALHDISHVAGLVVLFFFCFFFSGIWDTAVFKFIF